MMSFVNYLKEPVLVARIQQYFGVKFIEQQEIYSSDTVNNFDNVNDSVRKRSNNVTTSSKNSRAGTPSQQFEITNKFWYYLFTLGTALGDEVFYASFIPFWFWNIDGAVGRRVILVWATVMYVGQGIKDIIRWPRPGYPVIRLQDKWSLEYGMPSTHAMVGVSIPFSVLLYTMDRYQYSVPIGIVCALLWCSIICVSRLYLGMHTVLDIIAGLLLSLLLMIPLVPLVDRLDNFLLTKPQAPLILLTISILMIIYYPPSGDKWTPTRGDTTMMVSVCVGVHIGAWTNYQLGAMSQPDLTPPFTILWPTLPKLGQAVLRTILGFACVLGTKIFAKWVTYSTLCAMLRLNVNDLKKSENTLENKQKNFVELSYKYFSCAMIGFNTLYTLPIVFRFLGIERPTFYTEI